MASRIDKILIIDDEKEMLANCRRILERFGFACQVLQDSVRFSETFQAETPDLILTDLRMPRKDGMDILKEAKAIDPNVIVILFTAYGTIESAVEACKLGAFDYIQKPFSAEQLRLTVQRGFSQKKLADENRCLRSQLEEVYGFERIIGKSAALMAVLERVKKVSKTGANILIQGESGTGKELIARGIHTSSDRCHRPFVPVDCASLPENLLESELFGHEKGAFTGAHATRPGIFEYAGGGTLFLDEIGELSLPLQSKLLRVLQERQVRRVGGRKHLDVDVRIISASNRDLRQATKQGRFREDLYYRVDVITITLPPLRDRKDDIPLIARHYLHHYNKSSWREVKGISKKAMAMLECYRWPGNVRELQNVIERAVSLTETDMIQTEDLPEQISSMEPPPPTPADISLTSFKAAKKQRMDLFELEYLSALLKRHEGNISGAAREAELNRKTIYRLLKRHKILSPRPQ